MAKAETAKAEAEGRIFPKRSKKRKKEVQQAASEAVADQDDSSQGSLLNQPLPQGRYH